MEWGPCWILCLCFAAMVMVEKAMAHPLVRVGDSWRYLALRGPLTADTRLAQAWNRADFDDTEWLSGASGFSALTSGYYREASLLTQTEFTTPDFTCALFRREFSVADPAAIRWLELRVDYNDGFVAYLNGVEIARRGLEGSSGSPVSFTALASQPHASGLTEEIDVSALVNALKPGRNLLAIQLHNAANSGSDLVLVPELVANFNRGPFVQPVLQTSATVVWKTPATTDGWINYGPNPDLGSVVHTTNFNSVHAITLTNLVPGQEYFYRVSSAQSQGPRIISDLASFRTLKGQGGVHFAVIGDSGQGSVGQYQLARTLQKLSPELVLHAGDVIYPSFTDGRADTRFFSVYQDHLASTPYFPTIGNHDIYSGVGYYLDAFFLPTNSVPLALHGNATTPENYYSFDHGDCHFVVVYQPILSQYKMQVGDPQFNWLTNDLASTSKPWKVLLYHMPIRTSSVHRFDNYNLNGAYDRTEVEEVLQPLAARHGVQLVINGHDHTYERFAPVDGVHNVVSGGGGGMLYWLTERDVLSACFRARYHCLSVRIEGDSLNLRAVDENGSEFDSMIIQRRAPAVAQRESTWGHGGFGPQPTNPGSITLPAVPGFHFEGASLPAVSGKFSNLGEVWINNDHTNLYVGVAKTMLAPGQSIFIFAGASNTPGVASLRGLGNGIVDGGAGQGTDGLDFLENLRFDGFQPSIAVIAGDTAAQGTLRHFQRHFDPLPSGQGAFHLDANFTEVSGAQLRQLSLGVDTIPPGALVSDNDDGDSGRDSPSPQPGTSSIPTAASLADESAGVIRVVLPLASLGAVAQGSISLGMVVGLPFVNTNAVEQSRVLDSGFFGERLDINGTNQQAVLRGWTFRLAEGVDSDHDGLADIDERQLGTQPLVADSDGDGLPDGWEVINGLDPLSASGADGADGDPDADGSPNRSEWLAGTNPRSASSLFRVQARMDSPTRVRLTWSTVPGGVYQVETSGELRSGYGSVSGAEFRRRALGENDSVTIDLGGAQPNATGSSARFFRVRKE